MAKFTEPCFETHCVLDTNKWVVVVTWGHSLRQRIDGLEFQSEMEADRWIRSNARSWLEIEDLSIAARLVGARLNRLAVESGSNGGKKLTFLPNDYVPVKRASLSNA
jgi:hypothetical protein